MLSPFVSLGEGVITFIFNLSFIFFVGKRKSGNESNWSVMKCYRKLECYEMSQ